TKMPAAGAAPTLKVPAFWSSQLGNGIEVMGTQSTETPTVELVIYLNGGHRLVPVAKAGLASLTAELLNESSQKRSSEELSQALEMLGSTIDFSASEYQSTIKVSTLTAHLDETLAILEEKLFQPAFTEADFIRVKQQQLQQIQHMQADPGYIADTALLGLLYGRNNALGVSDMGTLASVAGLTLADVKAFYGEQYRGANAKIVTVANLPQAALLPKLAGLSQWQGQASVLPPLQPFPQLAGGTLYLIDKPGAAQSVINIAKRAKPYDATGNYFKSYLMNYPLGGAFNSRINLNLRENKGYTYGARTGFTGGAEAGDFVASSDVRTDVTAKALTEFIKEMTAYQQSGMTPSELAFMRSSVSQGQALDYETPYQKAGFMRMIQRYQLSPDFTAEQDKIINTITKAELDALAATEVDIKQMIILVVGDKAKIAADLAALGYPIKTLAL
ncbi:MAG: M16 family metallopeptidase, partial [Shewanella sp.]